MKSSRKLSYSVIDAVRHLKDQFIPFSQGISQLVKTIVSVEKINDRRDYGLGVKLWDDKDPRAEQSFFMGGVPSFILSADQKILDWNLAFEMIFADEMALKRKDSVSQWYAGIENFKRIPNRETQLYGEAIVPITDRNRVVYQSAKYGRMVFLKLMTPVLDRLSGRVIGWSISLNINSVHERAAFFEDLQSRMTDYQSNLRFIVGVQAIAARSMQFDEFYQGIAKSFNDEKQVLVIGALHVPGLLAAMAKLNIKTKLTVCDEDREALRTLKSKLGPFARTTRLIHLRYTDLGAKLIDNTFSRVLILMPNHDELARYVGEQLNIDSMKMAHIERVIYSEDFSVVKWWEKIEKELIAKRDLDRLKHNFVNVHQVIHRWSTLPVAQ